MNLVGPRVSYLCHDCEHLNTFLASAEEAVGRFAVNKNRRQHLHQKFDSARIHCTHTTLRQGSPQTLVVTKIFTHNAEARRRWASRRTKASEQFTLFRPDQLRLLLSQGYSKIVNMEELSAVQRAHVQVSTSLLTMNQANRSLPAASMKRKLHSADIDVI